MTCVRIFVSQSVSQSVSQKSNLLLQLCDIRKQKACHVAINSMLVNFLRVFVLS